MSIPSKTKKGYEIAKLGDGVYINRPHQKRGTVQKGMIPTLKTSCADIGVVTLPCIVASRGRNPEKPTSRVAGLPTKQRLEINTKGVSNALTTVQKDNYVMEQNLTIRKLTPKECFRLMGFSDEDYEKASKVNSNTQLYKQAGNSIVVDVLYHIFKQLL